MTVHEKRCKLGSFIFVLSYFVFGYMIINWISSSRGSFVDVSIPADYSIPFIAPFIFGYILVYLSIVLIYLTINNIESWGRAVVACTLATTVAYIIFLTIPVRMDMRPELATTGGINIAITRFYYAIDLPYNCFPSLHVTYPTLATLLTWRDHRIMRIAFLAMALIVAISVILVKQHYIADVLAGFANACICFWIANITKRYWIGWFGGIKKSA
jgi:membrane-associated phospholipid phosphatase